MQKGQFYSKFNLDSKSLHFFPPSNGIKKTLPVFVRTSWMENCINILDWARELFFGFLSAILLAFFGCVKSGTDNDKKSRLQKFYPSVIGQRHARPWFSSGRGQIAFWSSSLVLGSTYYALANHSCADCETRQCWDRQKCTRVRKPINRFFTPGNYVHNNVVNEVKGSVMHCPQIFRTNVHFV